MEFSSSLVGLLLLFALIFGLPGAIFAKYLMATRGIAPRSVMLGVLALFCTIEITAFFVLTGPEAWMLVFVLAIGWGVVLGMW